MSDDIAAIFDQRPRANCFSFAGSNQLPTHNTCSLAWGLTLAIPLAKALMAITTCGSTIGSTTASFIGFSHATGHHSCQVLYLINSLKISSYICGQLLSAAAPHKCHIGIFWSNLSDLFHKVSAMAEYQRIRFLRILSAPGKRSVQDALSLEEAYIRELPGHSDCTYVALIGPSVIANRAKIKQRHL